MEAPIESLVSPDSELTIEASDPTHEFTAINLLLDEEVDRSISIDEALATGGTQDCSGGPCILSYSFPAAIAENADPGVHAVGVEVIDSSNESAKLEHNADLDVVPPSLLLDGTLSSVDGRKLGGSTAALEIEASDGAEETDSGIAELIISVGTEPAIDEIYTCEPGCPASVEEEFLYDTKEWGPGPTEVLVTAIDGVGNQSDRRILVNSPPEDPPTAHCPTSPPSTEASENPISPEEAVESFESLLPEIANPSELLGEEDPEGLIDPSFTTGEYSTLKDPRLVESSIQGGAIDARTGGAFTVGQALCMRPLETTKDASDASFVSGAPVAVYANSAPETDMLIRATALGDVVVAHARGSGAPLELSWRINIDPEAEEVVELPNGGLAIVDPSGPDFSERELPSFPSDVYEPSGLIDVATQLQASLYDLALANNAATGQVLAVIPPPMAVDEEGELVAAELTFGSSSKLVTVTRPEETVAVIFRPSSAPNPRAICDTAFASQPQLSDEGCVYEPDYGERDWIENFAWSPDETLFYVDQKISETTFEVESSRIYATDPSGTSRELISDSSYLWFTPQVSPDGETIVATGCSLSSSECGIYTMNSDGEGTELVLEEETRPYPGPSAFPVFNEDGSRIIYHGNTPTGAHGSEFNQQLYSIKLDGTDKVKITNAEDSEPCFFDEPPCNHGLAPGGGSAPSVSPDGKSILFQWKGGIWTVSSSAVEAEEEELKPLTSDGLYQYDAAWPSYSRDGTQIVYGHETDNSSKGFGLYIMNADGSEKTQVLRTPRDDVASFSQFSPDGEQIAYRFHGALYTMDSNGSNIELVSDGGQSVSATQVAENSGIEDGELAERLDERLAGIHELISTQSFEEVSDGEWAFCGANLVNAVECVYFYHYKDIAEKMHDRLFTARHRYDRSTRGNAFKHGFWTALMVRHGLLSNGVSDGLVFALLHEGDPPYSWDSRMDMLNDFVGNKYALTEGATSSNKEICEDLRARSRSSIFMGARVNPFAWANENEYHYQHLVFRKLKTEAGLGPISKLNGRTCDETWAG